MQKRIITAVCALALALPFAASAARIVGGEQPSLPAGPIAEDTYLFGSNVTSGATITGDLVAGGGNLLINGSISQDAALGGGSITMLATVGDDLRVGGGNVTVAGRVGGDLVAGGGNVQVTGAGIGGDVLWGGGVLRLEAPVAGNLTLAGGEVYINSAIKGSITFTGDKLTFGPDARVSGTVDYTSSRDAVIEDGAVVSGEITHTPAKERARAAMAVPAILGIGFLLVLLTRFLSALALGLFFRKYSTLLVEGAYAQVLGNIGRGTLTLIALPIVSFILMVTVVGLPFGLLGLVAFAAFMIASWILMPVILGSLVYKWFTKREYEVNWKSILLGVVANAVIGIIPVIGWIIQLGFMLLTIGAIVQMKWSLAREWR